MKILTKQFYERDTAIVARQLLGKRLLRTIEGKKLEGIIVETEAYFGLDDPASRARTGLKTYNKSMWGEPGTTFIYNVHKYWMLNAVAHDVGKIGAVLMRAVEPISGIETMKINRKVDNLLQLTSGPGKLTQALAVNRTHNEINLTTGEEIRVADNTMTFKIGKSHRIGVTKDLPRNLRFFIRDNKFVSKQ